MKKTLIALAVAAVVVPGIAAADAAVSGVANISFTGASNQGSTAAWADKTSATNQFGAAGEVDVRNDMGGNVAVGVDLDFSMATNSAASSLNLEQAFLAYKPINELTVIGGIFNNPLNYEHQDAPSRFLNSQGQIARIFDNQTALYENNVAGVAAAYNFGMGTVTAGVLDQLSHGTGANGDAQNSYVVQVAAKPVDMVEVKLGYVTQSKYTWSGTPSVQSGTAGNVADLHAIIKPVANATVALEYLTAQEIVDRAWGIYGNFMVTDAVGFGARYDDVAYKAAGSKNTTSTSINASYAVAKNLKGALEWRSDDNGTVTDDSVRLNLLAKF